MLGIANFLAFANAARCTTRREPQLTYATIARQFIVNCVDMRLRVTAGNTDFSRARGAGRQVAVALKGAAVGLAALLLPLPPLPRPRRPMRRASALRPTRAGWMPRGSGPRSCRPISTRLPPSVSASTLGFSRPASSSTRAKPSSR